MSDKHPPIPPNCEGIIQLVDGVLMLLMPGGSRRLTMYRPYIAAVARCAWLDEGMRRCAEKDKVDGGCLTAIRYDAEGERNAEAWRNWGEK